MKGFGPRNNSQLWAVVFCALILLGVCAMAVAVTLSQIVIQIS